MFKRLFINIAVMTAAVLPMAAQQSVSTGVTRGGDSSARKSRTEVSSRQKNQLNVSSLEDNDLAWMKVVYRSLDLTLPENAALYYPEVPADGDENMIRLMMRLLTDGSVPAYEYLDGREAFNDAHKLNVADMLDRFHILYSEAKGSTAKNPKYDIDESDVPATEVLTFYIIERWEVDRRDSRMRTRIEAICPVLHRTEVFGQEAVKYPMFWMKYSDLRPYLRQRAIFTDDDNNLATSTYDDYFTLGLYKGDIYKTRNLRNKSMMQLYPDPDDLARARDSIDNRLNNFEKQMWVPSLEEIEARKAAVAESDSTAVSKSKSSRAKSSRVASGRKADKKVKEKSASRRSTPSATRSVRNRKR